MQRCVQIDNGRITKAIATEIITISESSVMCMNVLMDFIDGGGWVRLTRAMRRRHSTEKLSNRKLVM